MLAMLTINKWGLPQTGEDRPACAQSGEFPRFQAPDPPHLPKLHSRHGSIPI